MPTIWVRTIGMSFSIEGVEPAGMDAEKLLAQLSAEHGAGVARVGIQPIEAVLIDHKSMSWPALLLWVQQWLDSEGVIYSRVEVDQAGPGAVARFSFEP